MYNKGNYRLGKDELLQVLESWDANLKKPLFLAACGGTALTLYGHKESTKDVDFLIPDPRQYEMTIAMLTAMGYARATGFGYKHPDAPWIFDLFRGQRIFETDLLDPVQEPAFHRVIKKFKFVTLACLNPPDLIISQMFRGTSVDVDDSITMIQAENLDLQALAQRYKETAGYYYFPEKCKTNLQYLIDELKERRIDATPLEEMSSQWTP